MMKIDSNVLFDQLLQESQQNVPKIVVNAVEINNSESTADEGAGRPSSPKTSEPALSKISLLIKEPDSKYKTNILTPRKSDTTEAVTTPVIKSPIQLIETKSPKSNEKVHLKTQSMNNLVFHSSNKKPVAIKLKQHTMANKVDGSLSVMEDHRYSYGQSPKKNTHEDRPPCVTRSVFSNTISTRNPVDIMLHQDKINILRQMSQVFNNEPTPVPGKLEEMSADSETSGNPKSPEGSNPCHESVDAAPENNGIEQESTEKSPKVDGNPSFAHEKATDTSELSDLCTLEPPDQVLVDRPIHLVTSKSKEEDLKITVKSWKGDHGEDYDVIDGFTFISFDSEKDMEGYQNSKESPHRKRRRKKRSELIVRKKRLQLSQSKAFKVGETTKENNPEMCSPDNLLHKPAVKMESNVSDMHDTALKLNTLLANTESNTKQAASSTQQKYIPRPSTSAKPLPKRFKLAKGIHINENDMMIKHSTYEKPESFVMKPPTTFKMDGHFVPFAGRLIALRGVPDKSVYPLPKVILPVNQKGLQSLPKLHPKLINEGDAEFALSALKCSLPDAHRMSTDPLTPQKNKWLSQTTSQYLKRTLDDDLAVAGPSRRSEEILEKTSNKNFKKNVTRFPSLSREMKRLNMNFVDMNELASEEESESTPENCGKDFCRLGCICRSLMCKPKVPTHCGKVECLFECKCNISSIAGPNFSPSNRVSILKLDIEFKERLAAKEKDFSTTVVQSDSGFHVVEPGKRKRDIKVPERFRDSFTRDEDSRRLSTDLDNRRGFALASTVNPILPCDYMKHVKKLTLEVPWFSLKKFKVWCMDHECYECECLEEDQICVPQQPPPVQIKKPEQEAFMLEPQILWLFRQSVPMPLSRCEPSTEDGHWLMKHWIHSSGQSARTCGYNMKKLEYKRHYKDTIPEPAGRNVGVTFKRTSSHSDMLKMTKTSGITKLPKIPFIEESIIPSSIIKDKLTDTELIKESTGKEKEDPTETEEQIVHQLVLHELIAEEEKRGELELNLSDNVCGKTLVVTETRFRKLISMCIIGVTGLSKQGRCFIRTSNSSSDLMKMQRIHHMIGNDSIDVGPYMKEVFFPSQPESRTRYVIVRCDQSGRWEIIGVISRKQNSEKPSSTPRPRKTKHNKSPPPITSPPPSDCPPNGLSFVNETSDSELPKITNVTTYNPGPEITLASPPKVGNPSITKSTIPEPTVKKNFCVVTNSKVQHRSIGYSMDRMYPGTSQLQAQNSLPNLPVICVPKPPVQMKKGPQHPVFIVNQSKDGQRVISCSNVGRPAALPMPPKKQTMINVQPPARNRTNGPKFVFKTKVSWSKSMVSKAPSQSIKIDNPGDNCDMDCLPLVTGDVSQCSAIDMRLNFKKVRLHWLPFTFSRKLIFSIFKLSYESQLPYSLKVKHKNSILKFYGRSTFVGNNPVLFLGQTNSDVTRGIRERKDFATIFKGTVIKYFIPQSDGICGVYSYGKKGTLLLRQDFTPVTVPQVPIAVDSLCTPNWQLEFGKYAKPSKKSLDAGNKKLCSSPVLPPVEAVNVSKKKGVLESLSKGTEDATNVATCESSVQTFNPVKSQETFEPVPAFTKDETAQLLMSTVNGKEKSFGIACYSNLQETTQTASKSPALGPRKIAASKLLKTNNWSLEESWKVLEKRKLDTSSEEVESTAKEEPPRKKPPKVKDVRLHHRTRKHHNDAERLRRKAIAVMYNFLLSRLNDSYEFKNNFIPKKQILVEATNAIEGLKEQAFKLTVEETDLRTKRKTLMKKMLNLMQGTPQEESTRKWMRDNLTIPSREKNVAKSWKPKPVETQDVHITIDANGSLCIDENVIGNSTNPCKDRNDSVSSSSKNSVVTEVEDSDEVGDVFGYSDSDLSVS